MRKPPPILAIALTVFFDILSFGLVIPDIQLRGEKLGAQGFVLGLTIACFSIAQFIVSPVLGRWSDSVGRRKILLVTTTLSALSYLLYSHASLLWILVAARLLNGTGGANIGVAYAYVADITKPNERGKAMGLLGAAFGLGFIFGPPVGASLVAAGRGSPALVGYGAAALAALNFLFVFLALPESLQQGAQPEKQNFGFSGIREAMAAPGMFLLLAMSFGTTFGFSNLESTFFRLGEHNFHLNQMNTALVLMSIGLVSAVMQGGVIRAVLPRFGEVNLLRFAYFLQVPALLIAPWANPWIPMLLLVLLLGVGVGLVQPCMSSLISQNAPPSMQGGIFGVTQSLGALARILGPMMGNSLFDQRAVLFGRQHWMPYVFGACVVMLPLLGSWKLKMPQKSLETAAALG
jgi:MFS family permease